jgi:hypothetical protein
MKVLGNITRRFAALAAVALLCGSAYAVPINITNDGTSLVGDVGKNATLGDNSPEKSFEWLRDSQVPGYNSITSSSLPAPVFTGYLDAGTGAVDVTGFLYAVLHYGKGSGGTGQGGGIVALYLNGQTGSFSFPGSGAGPNGKGGLSSVRLYKGETTDVPDGGATAALLGLGVLGLTMFRRKN